MCGQIVVCMQALAAIGHFSLDLRDPAKTLLEFCGLFRLNVDFLRFSCIVSLGGKTVCNGQESKDGT